MKATILNEEQNHLDETYEKLDRIEEELTSLIQKEHTQALQEKDDLFKELSRDMSSDIQVETLAELEAVNRIIEEANLSASLHEERLRKVKLLLKSPYFAKITFSLQNNTMEKDIYIGAAGVTDEHKRHFIVDWRSPIAELYYNQENGPTSYKVNGRTIEANLKVRRQFNIKDRKLLNCFDTTIAIEDPLLLSSLNSQRSSHLQAITATIQQEQNIIIRHEDVKVMLVNGIAGSGKTSILLQRIAYLFYTHRETLSPDQVYLLTPNSVFSSYIDNVLPDMGEKNPHIFTWDTIMEKHDLESRGISRNTTIEDLKNLEQGLEAISIEHKDLNDIEVEGECVLSRNTILNTINKFRHIPFGIRRSNQIIDDLFEKFEQRLNQKASDPDMQDLVASLSPEDERRIFKQQITFDDDGDLKKWTKEYFRHKYRKVPEMIKDGSWLAIDRIATKITHGTTLDGIAWLFMKIMIVGGAEKNAKYVVIDEVQDYTAAQLYLLSYYYPYANFLLLGDDNQAIYKKTASFAQIKDLFKERFEERFEEVASIDLLTSYRSSPEITALFSSLLPPHQQINVKSVQRPGEKPHIECYNNKDDYLNEIRILVDEAKEQEKLTAFIASSERSLKELIRDMPELEDFLLESKAHLPKNGPVVIDVSLAKGLEFDAVILVDAQSSSYPDTTLARHRLYTAISRATKEVALLGYKDVTSLLSL